jgi:hypothetical protein
MIALYNVWGFRKPWLPRLLARHVPLADAIQTQKNNLASQIFDSISVVGIDGGMAVRYDAGVDYMDPQLKD